MDKEGTSAAIAERAGDAGKRVTKEFEKSSCLDALEHFQD